MERLGLPGWDPCTCPEASAGLASTTAFGCEPIPERVDQLKSVVELLPGGFGVLAEDVLCPAQRTFDCAQRRNGRLGKAHARVAAAGFMSSI